MALVTIGIMAYKVAPYLHQALESVLMQQCSFDYEVLVADDCSPDESGEICRSFKKMYPDKIKILPCDKNLGIAKNFMRILQANQNEYIAILDGDDYWTDPLKLEKSVGFLQINPHYSGVCHNVKLLQPDGSIAKHRKWHDNSEVSLKELISEMPAGIIAASSFTFRSKALNDIDWMQQMAFNDYPVFVDVYHWGPVFGLSDVMSIYRKHAGGFTSGFNWDGYMQEYPRFYKAILPRVSADLRPLVKRKVFDVYYHAGSQFIAQGQWKKAFNTLNSMWRWAHVSTNSVKAFGVLSGKIFLYPMYSFLKKIKSSVLNNRYFF